MSIFAAILHPPGRDVSASSLGELVAPVAYCSQQPPTLWTQGEVGIGALLIPRKPAAGSERQPVLLAVGRFVVAADARLDEREVLGTQVGIAPADLAQFSDTDLVARAFERWGEDCCTHLLGDFAFIVYDRQEHRLFAAADAVGVRRLFYARLGDGSYVFASEEACLIALPELRCRWDLISVAFWVSSMPDRERSLFHPIGVVACGRQLTLANNRVHCHRWWVPCVSVDRRFIRDTDMAVKYRELLCQAVGDRLTTGADRVIVGLSGGMDSTTIAACAAHAWRRGGPRPVAGSFLFPGYPKVDETARIRDVRETLGISGAEYDGGPIYARDYPFGLTMRPEAPHALGGPLYELILHQARVAGADVVLVGFGGDELTSGSAGLATVARLFRGDLAGVLSGIHLGRCQGLSLARVLWRRLGHPLTYTAIRAIIGAKALRLLQGWRGAGLMVALDRDGYAAVAGRFVEALDYPGIDVHQETLLNRLRFNDGLLATDAYRLNAYRSAVEVRTPFYDLRIIDFVLSSAPDLWYRDGVSKWLPREAMSSMLPRSVCRHVEQTYFSQVVNAGLRHNSHSINQVVTGCSRPGCDDADLWALLVPVFERAAASGIDTLSRYAYFLATWLALQ